MAKAFDQISYINEYNKEKYDRITILVPKGKKEQIREKAKTEGKSVNEYIIGAINLLESKKSEKEREEAAE
jgi:predicted HicB family RNase H-like nuclease